MHFTSMYIDGLEWPTARPWPHTKSGCVLLTPPLSADGYQRCIDLAEIERLFQTSFWETTVTKFGHRALKFARDSPSLTALTRDYYEEQDLVRTFGAGAGKWLWVAQYKLMHAGHHIVSAYINETILDRAANVTVRKRWHYNRKVWEHVDEKRSKLHRTCDGVADAALDVWNSISQSDAEKLQALAEHQPDYVAQIPDPATQLEGLNWVSGGQLLKTCEQFLLAAIDLHHFLTEQVTVVQHQVLEYLQLRPSVRRSLYYKHIQKLYQRLKDGHEESARVVSQRADTLLQYLQQLELDEPEVTQAFLNIKQKLEMDRSLFREARDYLGDDSIGFRGEVPKVFKTVPTGMYHRRSKMLEKMALAEIRLMPRGVRLVVDKAFEILETRFAQLEEFDPADFAEGLDSYTLPRRSQSTQVPGFTLGPTPTPNVNVNVNLGNMPKPTLDPRVYEALGIDMPPNTACKSLPPFYSLPHTLYLSYLPTSQQPQP